MGISVVGCGPGGLEYVTLAACSAVKQADVVVGSPRMLAMFDLADKRIAELPARSPEAIEVIGQQLEFGEVAVLVSGDPGLFSLAQAVVGHFGRDRCRVIPGISSVQAAFAAIGVDGSDAHVISAHGREPVETADQLAGYPKLAVLAGTPEAMRWAASLADKLGPSYEVFICENLTLPDERVSSTTAEKLLSTEASSLTVLLLIRSDVI